MEETDHPLPKVALSKPVNDANDSAPQAVVNDEPSPLSGAATPTLNPSATVPPLTPNTQPSNQAPASPASHPNSPAVADDLDLIEKEWVQKAKHIVDKNKTDPYEQNREIAVMKADYMKKRYNRDQKLAT